MSEPADGRTAHTLRGWAMRRLAVIGTAIATLGASSLLAVATAAGVQCTYTFPPEGGEYPATATDGDVICGGPGSDTIWIMLGGTFYGGGGNDWVRSFGGGDFYGGPGDDATYFNSGAFHGGPGDDWTEFGNGTFDGGPGNDQVAWHLLGTFDGGLGDDYVAENNGMFNGGAGNDRVRNLPGFYWEYDPGTFNGGPGDDVVEWMGLASSTFNGGPGVDTVIDYDAGSCTSVLDCPR